MATLDTTGIEGTSLAEYRDLTKEAFRSAIGPDVNLSEESPFGMWSDIYATRLALLDEALIAVANGTSRDYASGYQQDYLYSAHDFERQPPLQSTATVTASGGSGTIIPEGSLLRSQAGDLWQVKQDYTIPSGGTVAMEVEARDYGPIEAAVGEIDTIVSIVGGWDSVTNAAPATIGRGREDDDSYNRRYREQVGMNAVGPAESLRSALLVLDSVRKAEVYENITAAALTERGLNIPVRTIVVVLDADNTSDAQTEIAETILLKRTLSLPMANGASGTRAISVNVTRRQQTYAVKYRLVEKVPCSVTLGIRLGAGFPSDGYDQIREALIDSVEDLGIAEPAPVGILYPPILSVAGVQITTAPTITKKTGGGAVGAESNVNLDQLLTLVNADITITTAT